MSFTILSPCGILGYGFPMASFQRGLSLHPDAIVVDAGSTDAGPHKLGKGVGIVSTMALKRDLEALVLGGAALDIPVVVGSAGGSGGEKHVQWTLDVLREIFEENALRPERLPSSTQPLTKASFGRGSRPEGLRRWGIACRRSRTNA